LHIEVPRLKFQKLFTNQEGETSRNVLERVESARERQRRRLGGSRISINAKMSSKQVKDTCPVPQEAEELLKTAVVRFALSPRAYFKIFKVARTIADLEGADEIKLEHISEALQYRLKQQEQFV
jgi:magnesium chelatase family protein